MRPELRACGVRLLVTVCAAGLVAAAVPLSGAAAVVAGCAGGVALVAVAPGEALMAALFPRRKETRDGPSRVERTVWSVALSLACAALGGLLLNVLPGGIGPVSWVVLLGGVAVAGATVAAARGDIGPAWPRTHPPRRQAALVTAAAMVAAAAVTTAAVGAARVPSPSFAELSMIRTDPVTARLAVHSDADRTQAYVLVLWRNQVRAARWPLTITPGTTWRTTVAAPPRASLYATLYRGTSTTPYRHVTLSPPVR